MYTVPQLVDTLNLETEHQVRNRIEALRDLLVGHLRRGPNNQLLVTESGLAYLQALQALCETGHTLKEAAALVRYQAEEVTPAFRMSEEHSGLHQAIPDHGWPAFVQHLAEQVRHLEARVRALEAKIDDTRGQEPWWDRWS